jgi:dolichol-phosphate mannosyltransferase
MDHGEKVKLLLDSVTSFSFFPIRIMSVAGFCLALLGFLYALFVIVHAILRRPVQGWASLMVAVLVIGGMQMLMMGVLGEYLWRTLDESRRRPRFLIEETTENDERSDSSPQNGNLHDES